MKGGTAATLRRGGVRYRGGRRRLRPSLVVLLVFGAAVLAAGCGRGSREDQLTYGKEVYAQECSRCHMVDGSGAMPELGIGRREARDIAQYLYELD